METANLGATLQNPHPMRVQYVQTVNSPPLVESCLQAWSTLTAMQSHRCRGSKGTPTCSLRLIHMASWHCCAALAAPSARVVLWPAPARTAVVVAMGSLPGQAPRWSVCS